MSAARRPVGRRALPRPTRARAAAGPDLEPFLAALVLLGPAGLASWRWTCGACGRAIESVHRVDAAIAGAIHSAARRCEVA